MGKIFLVRHGQTAWNRANAYIGSTDLPITSNGREEAALVANRLEEQDIAAIYASSLLRARQTAEVIAERFNLPIRTVHELREVNYGEWEGIPESEVGDRYPDIFPRWRANPMDVRIPAGETFAELRDRAFPAFMGIVESHRDENIAIAAHKSTNRVILCCVLEMDVSRYRQIGQVNSAINVLNLREDGRLIVEQINDTCHLRVLSAG